MYHRIAVILTALAFGGCVSDPPTAPPISKVTPLARSESAEAGLIRGTSAEYEPGWVTINAVIQDADQLQKTFWISGTIWDPGVHVDTDVKPDWANWNFELRPVRPRDNNFFIPAEGDSFPFYYLRMDTLNSGFAHWSVRGNRITLRFPLALSSPSSFTGLATWTFGGSPPFPGLFRLIDFTEPIPIDFGPIASRP